MTADEWYVIADQIEDWFQGDFGDRERESYALVLRDRFEREEVVAACLRLMEQGKVFVPKPGEIIDAIRRISAPVVPSWTEVWHGLQRAMSMRTEEKAVAWLEAHVHPWAAAFLVVEGWTRLRQAPLYDEEYGQLRIAELKKRWEDYCERAVERERNGHALTAAGVRRGVGPRAFDPANVLASLGAPAGELPPGPVEGSPS